ncbi:MAG TPA: 50S ribosomal protein L23 [Candidatus Thioglobus sp.]|jgi:large subunit ribosomal protein L23|nr:50S ribosomal protein L23 [Candidatus Thioglobus sp.]HIL20373.1 50S ribosomal protein L23 [Candidatus Thioglobus sp.]
MNQEKVLKVLLGPVVSEKTTMGSINNQYVFRVTPDSNKREIRTAVETLFGVKVEAVTTLNVKGKKKMFKGKSGRRVNWKKAVVKVAEGQMIDVSAS